MLNSTNSNNSNDFFNTNENEYEILPESFPAYDLSFKIIIIGNSGVGKSCLTLQATKKIFKTNTLTTIGFECTTFIIRMKKQIIKLQIWDTCGQEIYRSLITSYYKNSALTIIVYAINDKATFLDIPVWINQVMTNSNPDIKFFLVGNKADLEDKREVTKQDGEELMKKYNFNGFLEVSARTGFKATELFISIASLLQNSWELNRSSMSDYSIGNLQAASRVSLESSPKQKKKKKLTKQECC